MYLIILAAGQGKRLRPLTNDIPKCLVKVKEKTILDWQIEQARQIGIKNISIIRGYRKEAINKSGVVYFENPLYDSTNMVETLMCAKSIFKDGFIISYGDIIYEKSVLEKLLSSDQLINVVVDTEWLSYWEKRFDNVLDDAETLQFDLDGRITNIGQKAKSISEIQAQYIGLMSFKRGGVDILKSVYQYAKQQAVSEHYPLRGQRSFSMLYLTDVLQGIIDSGYSIQSVPVQRGWVEIDSLLDLELANQLIEVRNETFRIIQ